jgi:hypothetical protein
MPITMLEVGSGFEYGPDRQSRLYILRGDNDPAAIQAHLLANTLTTLGTLRRGAPIIRQITNSVFEARVTWGSTSGGSLRVRPETTDFFQSFETQRTDVLLTYALEHIGSWGNAGSVSTLTGGAINVDEQGVPQGVSVPTGNGILTERGFKPVGSITTSWLRDINRNAFKINSDNFRGFSPGEVLFLGSRGEPRVDKGDYEIVSQFAIAENRGAFVINAGAPSGETISVPGKRGFDFLWVQYRDVPDVTGRLKKIPDIAHLERVYDEIAFSSLDLPDPP